MLTKSKAWHDARLKGVGGSEVGAILNLPPYGCSRRLWYEKRETKPDFEPETNLNMQRGIYLEDIVREIYSVQTLNRVDGVSAFASKEYPFMLGNVDGIISRPAKEDAGGLLNGYDFSDQGILEIKCPSHMVYTGIKRNGISEDNILQGQHYMCVADKEWMDYAIFCADMWELLVVPVKRDNDLIKMIIEQEEQFWKHVTEGPIIERLEEGDKRCKKCIYRLECWQELWKDDDTPEGFEDDYVVVEDPEYIEAYQLHIDNKELVKEAEALVEDSKQKLIDVIGNEREMTKCDLGKATYKWQKRTGFDKTKLKKDHPKIVEEYSYEGGSLTLRTYPKKDK